MSTDRNQVTALVGRGIRVDFVPHRNGQDVLQITQGRDGLYESAWGSASSIDFYRNAGFTVTAEAMSVQARSIMERRLPEADAWPVTSKRPSR